MMRTKRIFFGNYIHYFHFCSPTGSWLHKFLFHPYLFIYSQSIYLFHVRMIKFYSSILRIVLCIVYIRDMQHQQRKDRELLQPENATFYISTFCCGYKYFYHFHVFMAFVIYFLTVFNTFNILPLKLSKLIFFIALVWSSTFSIYFVVPYAKHDT